MPLALFFGGGGISGSGTWVCPIILCSGVGGVQQKGLREGLSVHSSVLLGFVSLNHSGLNQEVLSSPAIMSELWFSLSVHGRLLTAHKYS